MTTLADKLRAAADLIEAHPGLPVPVVFAYSSGQVDVTWQLMNGATKDTQRDAAQQILRAVGGKWQKKPWDDRFDFEQDRDGLNLQIYTHRDQVCERRVVGTEAVTIPASEAIPAQPERTEEREIVEWDCSPVLAEAAES